MVCDMKEIQIRKNDAGQRLDRFVGKAVPLLPESLLQKYIRLKRIKRNGKAAKRDVRLVEGDVLQLYINDEFFEKPTEHNAWLKIATPRLDIVYEDENILLADKKPGVLCHSAGEWSWDTLISNIQAYLRQTGEWDPKAENAFTPALCNRIDRNTGGIVIAAIYRFSAFGIGVVSPVEAHVNYDRSPKVINLITRGTANFREDKILEQQCRFIQMKNDKTMTWLPH